jgi:TolB protein
MEISSRISRRRFLTFTSLAPLAFSLSCRSGPDSTRTNRPPLARFFFVSQGKTAIMNSDGSGLRYLELNAPKQEIWQPSGFFSDGRRVLFLSMEKRRDGPGRPFNEYYTLTPTHLWTYDLESGALKEIATLNRMAVFYTPQLLLNDDRMLVQVVRNKVGQIFSMNLDGSDAREFTRADEGFPYGLSLSPDGRRVAFHLAAGSGYEIWTSDLDGADRIKVAARPGHIYFGPMWSPDGQLLAYQDCEPGRDPGHDWSDIWVARPDGSEQRPLTREQPMWFAATYGNEQNHGGGSNVVAWTHDGAILFPRRLPGSKVAWEFQPQRPDTDHFNRDYKPDLAQGGTEIHRLDPRDGSVKRLTGSEPPVWDFRCSESPDRRYILFCRAAKGEPPAIWLMDTDGANPHMLSKGLDERGADHPRWIPIPSRA